VRTAPHRARQRQRTAPRPLPARPLTPWPLLARPLTPWPLLAGAAAILCLLGAFLPGPGLDHAVAGPTHAPTGTPTPGVGATPGCARLVAYNVGGHSPTPSPLPPPGSKVGGAVLATPGLHVATTSFGPPPQPRATAWLVADVDTGAVLAACNAHVPLAPASTLKVLTALALKPLIDPARTYVARDEDARVDGTKVGLVPGSVYSSDDLWHALLMDSGNDAATALAAMAGGAATATDAMQKKAGALGAADTRVVNTSGLDAPGQVTSAYDLALFGRAALADPRLRRLMVTREYAFPEAGTVLRGPTRKTFQVQNHNRLIYNYPGAIGVKNGWTSTTGGSFIGAATRGGHTYLVTVLAADPETWHMCAALLDWAFRTAPVGSSDVGQLVSGPDPQGALTTPRPTAGADGGVGRATSASGALASSGSIPATAVAGAGVVALIGIGTVGGIAIRRARRRVTSTGRADDDPWRRRRSW
jgi:D-alanyl-D-alanine carboxypeptidase (penicillin-binding protein 5/6)